MRDRVKKNLPPWKRPSRWIGLLLALAFSVYLIDTMPGGQGMPGKMGVTTSPPQQQESALSSANTAETDHQAFSNVQHKGKQPNSKAARHHKKAQRQNDSKTLWDKINAKSATIGSLLMMVAIASMIGSIAEARKWHLIFGYILGRFSRMMRLPAIVGIAMPTALYSNTAANSMLVSSHSEGKINRSSLIAGGMANSYLSYLSHSLRVMYPVIGAIGIPGAIYFCGQFSTGLVFILCVLIWHRRKMLRRGTEGNEDDSVEVHEPPLPWNAVFKKSLSRVLALMFRMMLLSIPLMIFVEWLMKKGAFDFWEQYIPDWVNRIFPAELMGIVAAQMGGLVQSATVAANLRDHGAVTNSQIVLAMLVASAIGNPFRAMRRNLPSALGIFPAKEAFTIVLGMQLSRIFGALLLIFLTVLFIHYTHP